jgi:2-polyprenyl-3-methyl-5-hydroxy-6-metoxy-1,4-benzoquinol methylase
LKIFSDARKRLARAILIDRATPEDTSFIGRIARERSEENYRFAGCHVAGKTVLDVGGGAGIGHDLLFQGRAVSIKSIEPYVVATAFGGDPRVSTIRDDFLVHSFGGEEFDVVICLGTLFYMRNADAALYKMQLVLRNGGLLIINCINQQLIRAYFKMPLGLFQDAPGGSR